MMKKFLLSFFTILSFLFYTEFLRKDAVSSYVNIDPATETPTSTVNQETTPTNTPTPKPTGIYRDGSYLGSSADAYYGYIEVKAVVTKGKLSDVIFLDYPKDRRTSISINTRAMPILKSEAILSQNANVDTVSGATDSSVAFRQSLASALAQAKN